MHNAPAGRTFTEGKPTLTRLRRNIQAKLRPTLLGHRHFPAALYQLTLVNSRFSGLDRSGVLQLKARSASGQAEGYSPMFSVLTSAAPVFLLTFIGWAARRGGTCGEHATGELNRFVVNLALPARGSE